MRKGIWKYHGVNSENLIKLINRSAIDLRSSSHCRNAHKHALGRAVRFCVQIDCRPLRFRGKIDPKITPVSYNSNWNNS